MFSATFKVINNIRNEICSIAAQTALYKAWSDEFARTEISEVVLKPSLMRKKADTIILDAHLQDMNGLELHESGFREWDPKMTPGLFLIPLYLVGYMDPHMAVIDIYGKPTALGDVDNEERYGVISAGFVHAVTRDRIVKANLS